MDGPTEKAVKQPVEERDDAGPFNIPPLPLSRETLMVLSVCLAQVLVQACAAQGILPNGRIGTTFGVNDQENAWGPAAYALTQGTFMLPAGRIGDMYGHRRCFAAAYIWLSVSSLMTGLSPFTQSFAFYAFCRGLQGMAGAMLIPCALAILGSVYKEGSHRKNLTFGFCAASAPLGFTIGSVFSALISQTVWWPWMFFVTTIVSLGASVLSYCAVPVLPGETRRTKKPETNEELPHQGGFDWMGCSTGVSGLLLLNVAWNRAPVIGWNSAEVICTFLIGILLLVAFVCIEARAQEPLIPVSKLSRESITVLVITGFGWASFGVLLFYSVNFTLNLRGDSLLSLAAQILPVPIAGFMASYLNVVLFSHGFHATDVLALSLVGFFVGNVILATMPVHQLYWKQAFWIYVLAPFGMDLNFPAATLAISRLALPENQGIAASLVATVVFYSQAIGLGAAGTAAAYTQQTGLLDGYRAASYTGIGLSGFGLLVALLAVLQRRWSKRK